MSAPPTTAPKGWQHGGVTSSPGHPPLDFSPLGLARWPGPKWVEFFQGTIGQAVSSVVLAHFVEGGGLILVKTAPRQRWDREMGGSVEGEMNPGRGIADFAFDLVREMTDSGRPALDGDAALEGEERASYNRGLVTRRGPRSRMGDVGASPVDSRRSKRRREDLSIRPCVGWVQR
jgi:hypothetical protein